MTHKSPPMSAEALLKLPHSHLRYELIGGELKEMAPAGHEHGNLAHEIALSLGVHVKANKLGRVYAAETGFKLTSNPDTVRAPEVAFVSAARLENVESSGYFPGPPDLAVEII